MSITQDSSGSGLYIITSSGFKGLFNAIPPQAIGDEYLADMKNLHVTEFGILQSVPVPTELDLMLPEPKFWIHSISRPFLTYIGMAGYCYEGGNKLMEADDQLMGFHFVRYLGKWYTFTQDEGLFNGMNGTNITTPGAAYGEPKQCHAICAYEGRLWIAYGNVLRGSGRALDPEAVDMVNGNRKIFGPWTGPNANIEITFTDDALITGLWAMAGGLYIFTSDHVYTLSTFWGGVVQPIYQGTNLPNSVYCRTFPYSDGQTIYYGRDNAFYSFVNAPQPISAALALDINACYAAEFNNRIWFLASSATNPIGYEVNYLYAMNKVTGSWERYDIQLTPYDAISHLYDTLTAMVEGPRATLAGEDDLLIGTSKGKILQWKKNQAETASLPWSFRTKAYSPSFDVPHVPVKFRIDYVSQAATSPVVVTTYINGVAAASTITFDMTDGVGGAYCHREFDIPSRITAHDVQFLIEGTGKAEIMSVGYSLSTYGFKDVNP